MHILILYLTIRVISSRDQSKKERREYEKEI